MRKQLKLRKLLETCSNSRKKKVHVEMLHIERDIMRSIDSENFDAEMKAISKSKSDPKQFYSFAKKKNSDSEIHFLRDKNGIITNDECKMASILNEQYYSVFNRSNQVPHIMLDSASGIAPPEKVTLSHFFDNQHAPLTNIVFNEAKVCKAIDKMKITSAPGPDKITPYFLKMTKIAIAKFLLDVMNQSMATGIVPE